MKAKVTPKKVEAEPEMIDARVVEMKAETIFTAAEVAVKLRTHRYTVYKLFKDGRLKGFRVSNQWRCTATELDRFMSTSD